MLTCSEGHAAGDRDYWPWLIIFRDTKSIPQLRLMLSGAHVKWGLEPPPAPQILCHPNNSHMFIIDYCFGLLSCTVTGNNYSISYNIDLLDARAVELSLGLICGDACVSHSCALVLCLVQGCSQKSEGKVEGKASQELHSLCI